MDLADVKAAVASIFPYYVDMLRWEQHGNVITAIPKKPLGDQAHQLISKAFHNCGGRYVRRNGVSYFELVLKDAEQNAISSHSPVVAGADFSRRFSPANEKSQVLFTRIENQLSSLSEAGRQCTEA